MGWEIAERLRISPDTFRLHLGSHWEGAVLLSIVPFLISAGLSYPGEHDSTQSTNCRGHWSHYASKLGTLLEPQGFNKNS